MEKNDRDDFSLATHRLIATIELLSVGVAFAARLYKINRTKENVKLLALRESAILLQADRVGLLASVYGLSVGWSISQSVH